MNWININVADIDSEEFLGSDPTQRATWLCLLRYCCGQENGGRIAGARQWKDRKWQQVVRVMLKEISNACDLWVWDGDDLVVTFYPVDKEHEVQQKRESGRKGGQSKSDAKGQASRKNGSSRTQAGSEAEPKQEAKQNPSKDPTERKGIGKEGNGKEDEEHLRPHPPKFEEVKSFAKSSNLPIPAACIEAFFDEMESVQWTYRGHACIERPAWQARFRRFSTNWNNNERGRDSR